MKWRKRGLVWSPSGHRSWAKSHAYLPTADVRDDRIRVYFAALDADQRGRIGYADVDLDDPTRVIGEAEEPVLDLGAPGAFDDAGVNASSALQVAGETRMYYIGWQRGQDTPYQLFAGLAASGDGGEHFERSSRAPVLERTNAEPFFRSAPAVIRDDAGYRMWYVSTQRWCSDDGRLYPEYVVRTAESVDGLTWTARDEICIDFATPDEYGFGRPWVVKDRDRYRMWYSIRSRVRPYRIGYAESPDGLHWQRKDAEAGIEASPSGWDSEMICFACVVDAGGRRLMFHNGNRHGATGFGVAELESD